MRERVDERHVDLELVAAFVNTRDLDSGDSAGTDALGDPGALGAWLTERDLLPLGHPVEEAAFRRAIAVREAIRALAERNNPAARAEEAGEAAATLNRIARDAPLIVRLTPGGAGSLTSPDGGVDGVLGELLGVIVVAMADGSWARFKACARRECRWAYVDRSRNRSRTWCTMVVCGNREKARAYRERRKAER